MDSCDEFEFYPLSEDVVDFPWMDSDSWERTAELGMSFNMFDDGFIGGEQPVDLIELQSTIQATGKNDAGNVEVTCLTVGRVMWNATDGRSFDTRLIFELISREGFLRIREIREIPRIVRDSEDGSVESSTWGSIKNSYR